MKNGHRLSMPRLNHIKYSTNGAIYRVMIEFDTARRSEISYTQLKTAGFGEAFTTRRIFFPDNQMGFCLKHLPNDMENDHDRNLWF